MRRRPAPSCAECKHFQNQPSQVEAALPGLSSLSSAYAAVRCSDGICAVHARYVAASASCPAFSENYAFA
jgi:hypothetical protein